MADSEGRGSSQQAHTEGIAIQCDQSISVPQDVSQPLLGYSEGTVAPFQSVKFEAHEPLRMGM